MPRKKFTKAIALLPTHLRHSAPSSSDPSKTYNYGVSSTGLVVCNCRGWSTQKFDKPRTCKHAEEVVNYFIAVNSASLIEEVEVGKNIYYAYCGDVSRLPTLLPTNVGPTKKKNVVIPNPEPKPEPEFPVIPTAPSPVITSKTFAFSRFRSISVVVPVAEFVRPMLAGVDEELDLDSLNPKEWTLEEKYDGHRIIVTVNSGAVECFSRPKDSESPKKKSVPAEVEASLATLPDGTYDGELLVPGGTSSDVTALDKQDQVVVVLFDVMFLNGVPTIHYSYVDRRNALLDAVKPSMQRVSVATTFPVSQASVDAIWARGGEGAILKQNASIYIPGGRQPERWKKIKKENSFAGSIIGFESGKLGPFSVFRVKDKAGAVTTVKVKNNAMLASVTADPMSFVGKAVRVKYQEVLPTGGYRHPRFDRWENE